VELVVLNYLPSFPNWQSTRSHFLRSATGATRNISDGFTPTFFVPS